MHTRSNPNPNQVRVRGQKTLYFGLFALGLRLAARPYRGAWAAEAPAVNVALLLLMLGASSLPKPSVRARARVRVP